jgi:Anti-sigma-K factor rskA
MGLCTSSEAAEVEQLRMQYAQLDSAIVNFEIELEQKMFAHASTTNAQVDTQILQSFKDLSTPIVSIDKNTIGKVKQINTFKSLAAASMLLLGVSTYFNYTQYQKNTLQAKELVAKNNLPQTLPLDDYNILKNPSIVPVAMMGQGYHEICRCTMFWDKKAGKAYVMVHHLVPLGENLNYQMWANVNGKQVSVGLINEKIRDRFVEVKGLPDGASEFTVTMEKKGGAQTPDSDVILKGIVA